MSVALRSLSSRRSHQPFDAVRRLVFADPVVLPYGKKDRRVEVIGVYGGCLPTRGNKAYSSIRFTGKSNCRPAGSSLPR